MNALIYSRDKSLSLISLLLGCVFWAGGLYAVVHFGGWPVVAGVSIVVLLMIVLGFLGYVFIQSALISHLRGNSIEVTETQLPDLHRQFLECCDRLPMRSRPRLFVQNGNGVMNAFATWFLGGRYVILLSTVVDAMDENTNGVRFYIGHEMGHFNRHDNPVVALLRFPALCLPLLGAAFSRARESSCDLHGLAGSDSRQGAARSLIALMAGKKRWQAASLEGIALQAQQAGGFWMSFHELISSYPWTVKRVLRMNSEQPDLPRRNPFAYLLALFVPYAGRLGSGFGVLIYVYVVGILAAIAIPAYQDYTVRSVMAGAVSASEPAREALVKYYAENRKIPPDLATVGINPDSAEGYSMNLDAKGMVLALEAQGHTLLFVPQSDNGRITWQCAPGAGMKPAQLPPACR